MHSKKDDESNIEDTIKTEDNEAQDTIKTVDNEAEDISKAHPGPTLDEMIKSESAHSPSALCCYSFSAYHTHKDPRSFRDYVNVLADATPPAPSHLEEDDDIKKWKYRQLRTSNYLSQNHLHWNANPPHFRTVTATLDHLLVVFKDHKHPKQQIWNYYDTFLKVNNTDYKDSPFISQVSAKALFNQ